MKYFYDCEFLEGVQDIRLLGVKTGLKTPPTIDLISIGIVAEDGREYYGICNEFNLREAWGRYDVIEGSPRHIGESPTVKFYWIRENVLKPIWIHLKQLEIKEKYSIYKVIGEFALMNLDKGLLDVQFTYREMKRLLQKYGKSRDEIKSDVTLFCNPVNEEPFKPIELYGYYSSYDHVALCWLFGKMIDLPKGFPMYTRDLKQMFDEEQSKWSEMYKTVSNLTSVKVDSSGVIKSVGKYVEDIKGFPGYPEQQNEHDALSDARWNKKLYDFLQSDLF